jgi:hypothetical protein
MLKHPISEDLRTELAHNFNKGVFVLNEYMKNVIQSLNQPKTPTHFDTDIEYIHDDTVPYPKTKGVKLKTELINGKETLVGNYLFE